LHKTLSVETAARSLFVCLIEPIRLPLQTPAVLLHPIAQPREQFQRFGRRMFRAQRVD
jgi:hypothetical protein